MKRAAFLCFVVGASAALAACDLPKVTFGATGDDTTGGGTSTTSTSDTTSSMGGGGNTVTQPTGGAGGEGGGGEGGGTTTTTTSSSSSSTTSTSSTAGPVVQCNYPAVSNCQPGQVCCFDKGDMEPMDFCEAPGNCNPSSKYGELKCDGNEDCPGKKCCLYFVFDATMKPDVQSSYCADSCDLLSQEFQACEDSGDCSLPNIDCSMIFGNGYPEYKFCDFP